MNTHNQNSVIHKSRGVVRTVRGNETSDGAGVRLRRYIASPELDMLDPFLLLDMFRSDNPNDYLAGFPPHPHRGFETVTYLLHGNMRHRDSTGREGVIRSGGVQCMTAGSGIEHSEMPDQVQGLLSGFQLWVYLPASDKMRAPRYQEFEPDEVPIEVRLELLIARRAHFIAGWQVHPQLETRQQALHLFRHFRMLDAAARGHPLHTTGADHAFASGAVPVAHIAVQQIRYGFETAMRVRRKTGDVIIRIVGAKHVE